MVFDHVFVEFSVPNRTLLYWIVNTVSLAIFGWLVLGWARRIVYSASVFDCTCFIFAPFLPGIVISDPSASLILFPPKKITKKKNSCLDLGRSFWVFLTFSYLVPSQFILGFATCTSHHWRRSSAFLRFSSYLLLAEFGSSHCSVESCFLPPFWTHSETFKQGNKQMKTNFTYSLICNFYCGFL